MYRGVSIVSFEVVLVGAAVKGAEGSVVVTMQAQVGDSSSHLGSLWYLGHLSWLACSSPMKTSHGFPRTLDSVSNLSPSVSSLDTLAMVDPALELLPRLLTSLWSMFLSIFPKPPFL